MFTQYLVIELPCKNVTHLNKLYMLLEENANYEQYVYITYNVCTCKLTYVECKCNWKLNPIKLTGTDAIWYKKNPCDSLSKFKMYYQYSVLKYYNDDS